MLMFVWFPVEIQALIELHKCADVFVELVQYEDFVIWMLEMECVGYENIYFVSDNVYSKLN